MPRKATKRKQQTEATSIASPERQKVNTSDPNRKPGMDQYGKQIRAGCIVMGDNGQVGVVTNIVGDAFTMFVLGDGGENYDYGDGGCDWAYHCEVLAESLADVERQANSTTAATPIASAAFDAAARLSRIQADAEFAVSNCATNSQDHRDCEHIIEHIGEAITRLMALAERHLSPGDTDAGPLGDAMHEAA